MHNGAPDARQHLSQTLCDIRVLSPKIFVGVAIAAVAAGIALVMTAGPTILEGDQTAGSNAALQVAPVRIHVDEIRTVHLDSEGATLEIVITITNPNTKSAILSLVKYQIATEETRVAAGQIGTRSEGMVDASNYYTILSERSITLKDTISLSNAGGAPAFWDSLETGTTSWVVTGEAFFNLSSMTVGQENIVEFAQEL